jgi:DNA-binding helix-hairpin-helix protein with protein kinase domain
LADQLGRGGQATVYAVRAEPSLAVKIYHRGSDRGGRVNRVRKLLTVQRPSMVFADTPDHVFLTWPLDLVKEPSGEDVGFVMPRLGPGYHELSVLPLPEVLVDEFAADWAFLVDVAHNLGRLLTSLHDAGIVVGDLSPKNVMVRRDGLVSLLDCDSFQFRHEGRDVLCESVTPNYSAPELLGTPPTAHGTATDDFVLALLLCELLMCGDHPYLGIPKGVDVDAPSTPSESIKRGACHLVSPSDVMVPADVIDVGVLPPAVRALAVRAFGVGHRRPQERPTAERWTAALRSVRDGIMTCTAYSRHTFHYTTAPCPWCTRLRSGRSDPFGAEDVCLPADEPAKTTPLPPDFLPPPPIAAPGSAGGPPHRPGPPVPSPTKHSDRTSMLIAAATALILIAVVIVVAAVL